MPNYVKNRITIIAFPEKVQEIKDKIKTIDDKNGLIEIDFNNIIPQPENLFRGDLGRAEREMCIEKGIPNWYDWNIDNWGTKWNAGSCSYIEDNIVAFETAWSAPHPIVMALSEMYPDVEFLHVWADEDTGYNCGSITYVNGMAVRKQVPVAGSREAYDIAFKLWPDSKEYYRLEGDNYVYNDED
jgi:hypothetical protein